MLRGSGNAGERWKTTICLISKKATLLVQQTFFVHFFAVFLHDYNAKLPETFLTAATKLSCCSSNKKMSPLLSLALDIFRPFSRFISLACRLLSLFLCCSHSIFQICGHAKSKLNTSDNMVTKTISAFCFCLYWLLSCLCFTRLGWLCDFPPR